MYTNVQNISKPELHFTENSYKIICGRTQQYLYISASTGLCKLLTETTLHFEINIQKLYFQYIKQDFSAILSRKPNSWAKLSYSECFKYVLIISLGREGRNLQSWIYSLLLTVPVEMKSTSTYHLFPFGTFFPRGRGKRPLVAMSTSQNTLQSWLQLETETSQ